MTEIISVRFKNGGKDYYFNPNGMQFKPGDNVIIETARGVEFGECTVGNNLVDEMTLVSPLRPVLRAATPEDERTLEQNKKKEARAFQVCEQKILEHGLDMKLVDVEYNFEGTKVLFFFTSDGRVDFRELVKDLAGVFHTRIELRQIGVRDEAKLLGGLGICGRPFCCSVFLEDFQPVSIKMAKTQNLSLNPTKISGACGRLMCCLNYEQGAYEDALKRCPKNESLVETPDGVGTICSVNLLRETARVRLDQSPEQPQVYPCDDLTIVRNGKGKRPEGYELPPEGERPAPRLRGTAPAAPKPERKQEPAPAAEEPAQEQRPRREGEGKPRPRRSKSGRPKPEAAQPSAQEAQPPRPEKPKGDGAKKNGHPKKKPEPKAAAAPAEQAPKQETAEGGEKSHRQNRNRRPRRKPHPAGEGGSGAPKGGEG